MTCSSSFKGAVALILVMGAVSCGSVSPLRGDAGTKGEGGSSAGAAGSSQGTAGGTAGSGAAGQGGASGGGAGSNPDAGAGGSTHVDASVDRADRPSSCPESYTMVAEGSLCPLNGGTTCDYDQGRCGCPSCATPNGGSGSVWTCRAWDSGGTGCPSASPPIGSACTTSGQFCTYGGFCGISVGDNVECLNGHWQQMISPQGTCALRRCPTVGLDGGVDHPPDQCKQDADCPAGVCWQGTDGSKACVTPVATPTLMSCQNAPTPCCAKDGDCTASNQGRCLPLWDVKENYCGGAIPLGNVCRSDQCKADVDCKAAARAGLPVSACVPSGAFGLFTSTCVPGVCRIDADCAQHPGGRCQYGLAPTNGVCALLHVFYCAYTSDACGDDKGCAATVVGAACVPRHDLQGRECGLAPPQFP